MTENLPPRARVVRILKVQPHPRADRLDLIDFWYGDADPTHAGSIVRLVTGRHYAESQLGVFIPAGVQIPGYLAEDLWLVKRGTATGYFPIQTVDMRGIPSPGMFSGRYYRMDPDDPRSVKRYAQQRKAGDRETLQGLAWRMWRDQWREGDDVTDYLGIRR